ncbi:WxL domain-containing protein [Enterococcus hirae]|nr:WxL domain-containing protein [Enterococcus hirae]EMF0232648.1 WxL domain-containing protein [Enterococcus hirae]
MKKLITFLGIVCMLSQAISPSLYMVYAESFLEEENPQPVSELEGAENTVSSSENTVASENIPEKEDENNPTSVSENEETPDGSESTSSEKNDSTEENSGNNIRHILENESILQSFSSPPSGGPGPNDTVNVGGIMMPAPGRLRLWDPASNSASPNAQAWRTTWSTWNSRRMTDEQLDQQAASYLNLSNAPNVEVVGFTSYPNRSSLGQTTGTIQVQEKLSNGKYVQMTYEVPITVHQGLEATTMAQVLTLGEPLDLEKAVNEVKYNNTVLARDAYEFEYDPRHDLDVPGRRYTMVTVVHKASGERIQVQVHLTIRWGETLLFRGEADRSAGALAYLPGENKIVARRGDNIEVAPIHPDFPELYYSLEVLRNTASQQLLDELSIKKNYEAAGSRGVNGHVSGIGTISIEYGDILKVYHAEAQERLRIFNNEIEGALSHKDNIAYLELTPTGYRQVLIDRVTPRTGLISQNMTNEQLAQQAASYLNLSNAPNVEVVGFTRYPDRSNLGQTTGTIQVQEKLSNGKYVQMTYEVPFTVEGTRKITNVSNFDFGTIRKSNRRQIVTALNEEDTPLGLQLSDYVGTSNWSLQAYQSTSFQISNGDELRGVEIRLHNIVSQSDQADNLHTQNEVNLNTQPIEIANYVVNSSVGSHPVGNTTISFGTNHTPGVELQVPNSLEANEDTYRTTINWELVADPSQGVN